MTNRVRIIQQLIHRDEVDDCLHCPLDNGKDEEWCSKFGPCEECINAWLDEEYEEE